jgi:hypothetical protein
MASSRARQQIKVDDLGFPLEGDPSAFAQAFAAIAHHRDLPMPRYPNRLPTEELDDFGLPTESDPADFARAFRALYRRGLSSI